MDQLALFASESPTQHVHRLDSPFVVVDTETTALKVHEGYVIEVAARRSDGETFHSLICPPAFITPPIITGITLEMLCMAPGPETVFPQFHQFISGCLFVAHNAPFDLSWLKAEFAKLRIAFHVDFVDTLSLSRYLFPDIPVYPGSKSKYTLENLCVHFNIVNRAAHRAFADVDATFELYQQLIPICKEKNIDPINFVYSNRKSGGEKFDVGSLNH